MLVGHPGSLARRAGLGQDLYRAVLLYPADLVAVRRLVERHLGGGEVLDPSASRHRRAVERHAVAHPTLDVGGAADPRKRSLSKVEVLAGLAARTVAKVAAYTSGRLARSRYRRRHGWTSPPPRTAPVDRLGSHLAVLEEFSPSLRPRGGRVLL